MPDKILIEERIIELESRLAFQDDQLEQLNTVIAEQQMQLTETKQLTKVLLQRINDLISSIDQSSGAGASIEERPPHY